MTNLTLIKVNPHEILIVPNIHMSFSILKWGKKNWKMSYKTITCIKKKKNFCRLFLIYIKIFFLFAHSWFKIMQRYTCNFWLKNKMGFIIRV